MITFSSFRNEIFFLFRALIHFKQRSKTFRTILISPTELQYEKVSRTKKKTSETLSQKTEYKLFEK